MDRRSVRPPIYSPEWRPPRYRVDGNHRVVGGYEPNTPNNWGRWGQDDERGTANFVGPPQRISAAKLVRSGKVYSLAQPISGDGPVASQFRPHHLFSSSGSDAIVGSPTFSGIDYAYATDAILLFTHTTTHIDGLAHISIDDVLYNGFWAGCVTAGRGAARLGVEHQRNTFVGRGVLLDIATHLGVESLSPGFAIESSLLDEVCAAERILLTSGDMVLIRTGYLGRWRSLASETEREGYFERIPGLARGTIDWLHQHDIALIAADTRAVNVDPHDVAGPPRWAFHQAALVELGLTLGEFWDLDDLAAGCREDGVYDFFLVVAPLNLPGGVGSPVNPIAVK